MLLHLKTGHVILSLVRAVEGRDETQTTGATMYPVVISNQMVDDLSAEELEAIETNRPTVFIKRRCERIGMPLAAAPIGQLREFFDKLRAAFGYT
jgi:hypothetical protein